ncbi:MAG: beta-ketoacyl-ACP reductase, partial [bacterium]
MEIKGKNVLITGSAAGIGQATAFALADAGAAGI